MPTFTSPSGDKFECCNESEALFMWKKLFDEEEYSTLAYKDGDVIVDVGGNIGMFAKWAGDRCGPKSTVVSFEPMPQLRACLKGNVRATDIVSPHAISDVEETIVLEFLPNYTLLSGIDASANAEMYRNAASDDKKGLVQDAFKAEKVEATSTTLTKAMADPSMPSGPISVLKIDVEGMEWRVLSGIDNQLWERVQQTVRAHAA